MDDGFVVLMNAFHEGLEFMLPPDEMGRGWEVVFDTSREDGAGEVFAASSTYPLEPRSVVLLIRRGALRKTERRSLEVSTARAEAEPTSALEAIIPEPVG